MAWPPAHRDLFFEKLVFLESGEMISKVGMLGDKAVHLGAERSETLGTHVGSDFSLTSSPHTTATAFLQVLPKGQAAVDRAELASGTT